MTDKELMEIIEEQHKLRLSILNDTRKKRTAGTDDRLIQFYRMAKMRNCTPESAAIDLATKQFTDFLDMASYDHPEYENLEYFRELGADIQNYVDLTLAIAEKEDQGETLRKDTEGE